MSLSGDKKREIDKLVKELNYHCYLYHVLDAPVISDTEYDRLYRRLKELEDEHGYILPDSPTQRVGATPLEKFEKAKHTEPMLSLDNAFSHDEVKDFDRRIKRILKSDENLVYTVEPKYDGLAIELTYKKGVLRRALTRGDGNIGEDVTINIKTIKEIPLLFEDRQAPQEIDIRGEVYMDIGDFESLNAEREKKGEPVFANPRNAAAGSIRQLDSSITASRRLHLACYGMGAVTGKNFKDQWGFIQWLKRMRFPVPAMIGLSEGIEDVIDRITTIEEKRSGFPFEVDGAVVKVNDLGLRKKLGVRTREPRWAVAYKFRAHSGITKIAEIIQSVGRTGTITPVAYLEPVRIGGVTVSRSTLHNWDEIVRKDIRVGDTVVVERAGDVIPHVVEVLREKRTGDEKTAGPPDTCPICGSAVEKEEGGVAYRCIGLNCPAQVRERISHYASRAAMDIEGLGEKNVDLFFSRGLVTHFIDIYNLKKDDLLSLPRFAEKSAAKLIRSIEKSKRTTLARFIYSLGILHVGEYASKLLAKNYKDISGLFRIKKEEVMAIKQMGDKTAGSLERFFNDPKNLQALEFLLEKGLEISNPDYESGKRTNKPLGGLSFVVTGTMPRPRKEVEAIIENSGGRASGSVSKNTDYLVLGESPGSKYDRARSFGTRIISYDELMRMVDERSL